MIRAVSYHGVPHDQTRRFHCCGSFTVVFGVSYSVWVTTAYAALILVSFRLMKIRYRSTRPGCVMRGAGEDASRSDTRAGTTRPTDAEQRARIAALAASVTELQVALAELRTPPRGRK